MKRPFVAINEGLGLGKVVDAKLKNQWSPDFIVETPSYPPQMKTNTWKTALIFGLDFLLVGIVLITLIAGVWLAVIVAGRSAVVLPLLMKFINLGWVEALLVWNLVFLGYIAMVYKLLGRSLCHLWFEHKNRRKSIRQRRPTVRQGK